MNCRPDCGACCIAPSINSPIPGMPHEKPASVRCVQLADDQRCLIFDRPERPAFCTSLQANSEMCGENRTQAIAWLTQLERLTAPEKPRTLNFRFAHTAFAYKIGSFPARYVKLSWCR